MTLDPKTLNIGDNIIFICDDNSSHNGKIIEKNEIFNDFNITVELIKGGILKKKTSELKIYYKY